MNELFGSQQCLDLELFYKVEKTKGGHAIPVVITEDEFNKAKADPQNKVNVKSIRTKWRLPTWKSANDLLQSATVFNYHLNSMDTDWNKFRDSRLKALLVGWDCKDKDGIDIPCSEDTINMLHQNIALALLKQYDDATTVDKETETKNS